MLIVRKRDTGKMNALRKKAGLRPLTQVTSYHFPPERGNLSGHPSPTSYQIVVDLSLK
jgi:hypothetical protein